jgi:hypothetical protein
VNGAALALTLLVGAGEGEEPVTQGILAALAEALGADVEVVVRERPAPAERAPVARVRWGDPRRLAAELAVQPEAGAAWLEQRLVFQPADDLFERGRTVGFALAAMLPARLRARPPAPVVATRTREATASVPPRAASAAPLAVEAAAVVARGVAGDADGLGAALAVRGGLSRRLGWCLGVSGRFGEVEAAGARSRALHAGVGLVLGLAGDPARDRAAVGLRLEGGAFHESLRRRAAGDAPEETRARWLPGAMAALEATLRLGGGSVLTLGAGPEVALGRTSIFVNDRQVEVLPTVRAVAALGLRQYF